jgi:hypothetical protein
LLCCPDRSVIVNDPGSVAQRRLLHCCFGL